MKIVKKIFDISLVGFLLFFAVNVFAIDPPTGLSIRHIFAGTPPVATAILEWTGAAQNYKIYINGVFEEDYYDGHPDPNRTWLNMDVPPGDYVYGIESFDPVTGDVSSRLEQSYTVPVLTIDPPTSISLSQTADNQVTITWQGGTASNYNIYRDNQLITSVSGSTMDYTDMAVPAGNHLYEVASYNPTTNTESIRVGASIDVTGVATFVEDCTNGVDDDGNSLADCEDDACLTDPACLPPPSEICDNGIDDGNGNPLVDCEDPACLGTPECSGGGTHQPSGDLFPIIQCGYNCPGIFPGDPNADCCTLCDAFETISRIINIILMFGFILGGMFLVVAGIIMYAGGASSGLLNRSKTIIKGVIYGLVIMLVSYLIVFTIIHFLSAGNADTLFSIKNGGFVIECTP